MNFDPQFLRILLIIFIPTSLFIGFVCLTKESKKLSSLGLVLVLVLLCTLMLFRKIDASADFYNYTFMYRGIHKFSDIFTQYHGNIFFAFVMYLGKITNLEQTIFFTLYPFLILGLYAWGCKGFLPPPYATLALVFFGITSSFIFYSTNIIRQGLACVLFILATAFWAEKKRKTSALFQLFSFYSHTSALFLILANFFNKTFQNKRVALFLVMPLMPLPGFILLKMFSTIGGIFDKIDNFNAKEYDNKLVYIKIIILYACGILIYKGLKRCKNENHSENINHLFGVYLLILCVCFLTMPVLLIASRLIYYPSALLPIFFSYLIMSFYKGSNRFLYTFAWVWISLLYAAFVFNFNSTAVQLGL